MLRNSSREVASVPTDAIAGAAVDKHSVARAFSRAANDYDQLAQLQHVVGAELLQQLQRSQPVATPRCLDLGAGTGCQAAALQAALQPSLLLGLDIAPGMCRLVAEHPGVEAVVADFDALPLAAASLDVVYANFSLQWSNHIAAMLASIADCLETDGLLAFTTLLPGSMSEISRAWQAVDNQRHTSTFSTLDCWCAGLAEHFHIEYCDEQTVVDCHTSTAQLLASVRGIGAANHAAERSRQTLSKASYASFTEALAVTSRLDAQVNSAARFLHGGLAGAGSAAYGVSYRILSVIARRV